MIEIIRSCTGRKLVPPLGVTPGYESPYEFRNAMEVFTTPRDLKGLGQWTIRYYDDVKNPDQGFMYLPAFRRCIRISATTWQDNVGGGDLTYGDIRRTL